MRLVCAAVLLDAVPVWSRCGPGEYGPRRRGPSRTNPTRCARRLGRNELHLIHAGTVLSAVAWSVQSSLGWEAHLNRLDQRIPEFIEVATRRKAARKLSDVGPVGAVVFFVDTA
jgi:hypothetical protein